MKKLVALLTIFGMLTFSFTNPLMANVEGETPTTEETSTEDETVMEDAETSEETEEVVEEKSVAAPASIEKEPNADPVNNKSVGDEPNYTQVLKEKFIEGGVFFMSVVLLCLILGLALCIERIVYLNLATTNTSKLLTDVEGALASGGVDAAKEVCRNTRGPIASIFYQGLLRADGSANSVENVEKAVISYGGVQMGLLEKGTSWISLFIALAPMLGFMGTVIGMISAFDAIEANNNIQPNIVAGGIKQALLTTVFGLIVAMILQVFYNYIISKIDSIVNNMEDASISLVDIVDNHVKK